VVNISEQISEEVTVEIPINPGQISIIKSSPNLLSIEEGRIRLSYIDIDFEIIKTFTNRQSKITLNSEVHVFPVRNFTNPQKYLLSNLISTYICTHYFEIDSIITEFQYLLYNKWIENKTSFRFKYNK
jgi:hypothetical protein